MRSEERRAECKLATKCAPTVTRVQQVAGARARQAAQLDRQVQVETGPTEHYYGTPDVAKTPYPNTVWCNVSMWCNVCLCGVMCLCCVMCVCVV